MIERRETMMDADDRRPPSPRARESQLAPREFSSIGVRGSRSHRVLRSERFRFLIRFLIRSCDGNRNVPATTV